MKNHTKAYMSFVAGALLLIGALAAAQSKPAPKTTAPDAKASGKQTGTQNQSGQPKSPHTATDPGSSGQNSTDESKNKTASKPKANESKDKAAPKSNAGASAAPEYKDPEDMTTRYRPGNNKTTAKDPAKPQSGAASNSK